MALFYVLGYDVASIIVKHLDDLEKCLKADPNKPYTKMNNGVDIGGLI